MSRKYGSSGKQVQNNRVASFLPKNRNIHLIKHNQQTNHVIQSKYDENPNINPQIKYEIK